MQIKQLYCSCSFVHGPAVKLLNIYTYVHCERRECVHTCMYVAELVQAQDHAIVICPHYSKGCTNITII